MFDFFRNNMKFLMGLLMLLIIPSFVLFGIEGYSSFREGRDVVATVGKLEITRQEWDETHRNEVDRLVAKLDELQAAVGAKIAEADDVEKRLAKAQAQVAKLLG